MTDKLMQSLFDKAGHKEASEEFKKDQLDKNKTRLYDQLIDTVTQHTFAEMPFKSRGEPVQPELNIKGKEELYKELGNVISTWGKDIMRPKTQEEEAAEEADRRAGAKGARASGDSDTKLPAAASSGSAPAEPAKEEDESGGNDEDREPSLDWNDLD